MTNLPLGSYPPPQPTYAQHLLPGWESRIQEKDGPFLEAFDFSFDRYATPAVVKVVYMVTVILCVLGYVGTVLMAFAIFMPDQDFLGTKVSGSAFPGILALVLGWIPAFIIILGTRLSLEQALATVRTAIDARALLRATSAP